MEKTQKQRGDAQERQYCGNGDARRHHHHEKIIRTAEKRPKCVALEMEARRFHHTTQKYKIQSLLLVCAVKSY